jgi:malate dehydrogenase
MVTVPIHIAVTGAAGRISYSLLFRIAGGAMFGPDQPVALSLLDVPAMMPLVDATMMELEDCNFPLLSAVRASTDPAESFAGAHWVFMIGGAPFFPGMSRSEALIANGPIFQAQGRAINESAKTARVLVVANPCNTNCLIASSTAHDVPLEHWFAMTRLDENRARAILAHKARVPIDQVTRVTAWGNHSPSVFVDSHNAWIGDRPAEEAINDREWFHTKFEPEIAHRGPALYDARGASPAASEAQAILGTVRSITKPTPYERWFSAAVHSDGSYGVPRGLIFSFPLRTEDGRTWSIIQKHYLSRHAQERIAQNVSELEHEAIVVAEFIPPRSL